MKKFRRMLTTGIIASSLLAGTSAFANTGATEVDPGITPDQFISFIDYLGEDLQLFFASEGAEKTKLLIEIAKERLAETDQMIAEDKAEFVKELIDAYLAALEEAQEGFAEAALEGENADTENLSSELKDTAAVNQEIQDELDPEQAKDLEEKVKEVKLVASVSGYTIEEVTPLREAGLGYGQIAKVLALAEETGKTQQEILDMIQIEGLGFGEIAKELGVNLGEIASKGKAKGKQAEQESEETEASEEKTATQPADGEEDATVTNSANSADEPAKESKVPAVAIEKKQAAEDKKDAAQAKREAAQENRQKGQEQRAAKQPEQPEQPEQAEQPEAGEQRAEQARGKQGQQEEDNE